MITNDENEIQQKETEFDKKLKEVEINLFFIYIICIK